jgi:hypothetical protein
MVTDTGTTAPQRRGDVWVQVPVLIRDGRYCLCGDLHGRFKVCVGGEFGPNGVGTAPKPRRDRSVRPQPASDYFKLEPRRLPRAIPAETIAACGECRPQGEAFWYCGEHRSQAVRNVLLASRRDSGITSLHMMMADKGLDIVS